MDDTEMLRSEIQRLRARLQVLEQSQMQTTPAVIVPEPAFIPIGGVYGGGGSSSLPEPFDLEITETGGQPSILVKRRYIPAPETVLTDAHSDAAATFSSYATIYLNVTRGTSSYSIEVSQTQVASDATHASWILWEWNSTDGEYIDRRPKVLPLYAI